MKKIFIIFLVLVAGVAFFVFFTGSRSEQLAFLPEVTSTEEEEREREVKKLPAQMVLESDYHIFQTFNNCAPAALSMALSYYGVTVSQEKLAADLRPYNNLTGKNDDKSTPPEELAAKAEEYRLRTYYRA